ncbi:MAG: GldG family protein [Pseudomonadota bacterium]
MRILGIAFFFLGLLLLLVGLFINVFYVSHYFSYVPPFIIGGLSLIVIAVLLHFRTIRQILSQRSARYGFTMAFSIVTMLGLLSIINYFCIHHNNRLDLTGEKLYSLSPLTVKVLEGLTEPITITAFTGLGDTEKENIKDLLDAYQMSSNKLHIRYLDPDQNPLLAKNYQVKQYGAIVVEKGSKVVKVMGVEEENITNAIIKVARKEEKSVYFLTGHGEGTIEGKERADFSDAAQVLDGMGYRVKNLELFKTGTIPSDCSALMVPCPTRSLDPRELQEIETYLEAGGSAFIMVDPGESPELKAFLSSWKVDVGDNIVFDTSSKLYGVDFSKVVTSDYSLAHPVTKNFKLPTMFPGIRTVSPTDEGRKNLKALPLVWSSQKSWAETNLKENEVPRYDQGRDKKGPVSLAVGITPFDLETKKELKEGTRMVVVGDSSFLTNAFIRSFGNLDFFLNIINWLVQEEHLISIRPQTAKKGGTLDIRKWQLTFYPTVIFLFLATVVTGAIVWGKRRRA